MIARLVFRIVSPLPVISFTTHVLAPLNSGVDNKDENEIKVNTA